MKKNAAQIMNITGIVAMILLILICIPFTIPKLFGLRLYGVETGSMEPAYSVGSVVYVADASADEVQTGDVITYMLGSDTTTVMTHRVVEIREAERMFLTKGDANELVDAEPVSFDRLIGKPVFCIPNIAPVSAFMNSRAGMAVIVGLFLLVIVFWTAADKMKNKRN